MNDKLRHCYNQLRQILGNNIEPYESVALVEKYRQYWKPKNKISVILLAESHVFTSDEDRKIVLRKLPDLPGYPLHYAKFVYCLAYGERQLTENNSNPKRDGTPQFWKLLYSCDNKIASKNDFSPVLSKTNYEQRIKNKISLLSSLQQRGIWLVDSSIVALYNNGKKPQHNILTATIKKSWDEYTRNIVKEADPEHVICIGKTVSNILIDDIKRLMGNRYTELYQPNAHLSSDDHMNNYKKYSEICCK